MIHAYWTLIILNTGLMTVPEFRYETQELCEKAGKIYSSNSALSGLRWACVPSNEALKRQ
jgi:hypothetical protein